MDGKIYIFLLVAETSFHKYLTNLPTCTSHFILKIDDPEDCFLLLVTSWEVLIMAQAVKKVVNKVPALVGGKSSHASFYTRTKSEVLTMNRVAGAMSRCLQFVAVAL